MGGGNPMNQGGWGGNNGWWWSMIWQILSSN